MTTYLLNTPIITSYGEWKFEGPISTEQAKERVLSGFESAIGHDASAQFLSRLLGIDIPMNRIAISMQAGDTALVLRIKSRLPEGKILTQEEISLIPFELGWLKKLSDS